MTVIEEPVQLSTYNLLRAALALFKKSPAELAEAELQQAKTQALNEFRIESRVLNAPEAAAVIITEQELQQAYQEIQGRYQDEAAFFSDLEKNRLDKDSLLGRCTASARSIRCWSWLPAVRPLSATSKSASITMSMPINFICLNGAKPAISSSVLTRTILKTRPRWL